MALFRFLTVVAQLLLIVKVSAEYGLRVGLLVLLAIVLNTLQAATALYEREAAQKAKTQMETRGDDDECGNG